MQFTEDRLTFTEEQRQMIRDTYASGASDSEFAVLMEIALARKLNPLLKQVYFVKRWDSARKREVWSVQTSIDGLRAIAERTGKYQGQDEPEFTESNGKILCAKVKVYRKDWGDRPAVGVAYWSEFVQTDRDGKPTRFWSQMPHQMLGKVAEALALRKAFPEDMSGIYTTEEMSQDENEIAAASPMKALAAPAPRAPMATVRDAAPVGVTAEPQAVPAPTAAPAPPAPPRIDLSELDLKGLVNAGAALARKTNGVFAESAAKYAAEWKRRMSEASDLASLKRVGRALGEVTRTHANIAEAIGAGLGEIYKAREVELTPAQPEDAQ